MRKITRNLLIIAAVVFIFSVFLELITEPATCDDCHGTGICDVCGGNGIVYDVQCWECEGSGECTTCHGSGKLYLTHVSLGTFIGILFVIIAFIIHWRFPEQKEEERTYVDSHDFRPTEVHSCKKCGALLDRNLRCLFCNPEKEL